MRRVMYGSRERALQDESIWLCLTCETCSARCPNGCDPARVIDALRELARESGQARMPRNIGAFHKAFLEQIRTNGRLHEMGLVMDYKLKTGDLMKDVTNAPGMFARGKLNLRADKIDGVNEIKRIFEQCGVTP
jgi:heterodisulfide reductase subunit C